MTEAGTQVALPLAAERLWDVFQRLPGGVCVLDHNAVLVAWNRSFAAIMAPIARHLQPGVPFAAITTIAVTSGLILGDEGLDVAAWLRRAQERPPCGKDRLFVRFADGRDFAIDDETLPCGGHLVTLTDVSAIKEQERAQAVRVDDLEKMQRHMARQSLTLAEQAARLDQLRDEAERANRTKSEFLANMSHELRSPLNAVIGFSEIMKDELFGTLGSSQYREYAYDIWASGRHLLDVINDILDLSKIEAGKLELAEARCELSDVVGSCMRLVAGRAQKAEVIVRPALSADGFILWADERKLKQVLINLLTNAIKFTKPGGRVSVGVTIERDGDLRIAVADTGIGIAREDIPKALAAFGQIESTLAKSYEGTGLGLPLSKALAELHGGSLEIESEVGVGTTVVISIPAARVLVRPAIAAA
jgi:two-component system cell cycle sensor histidine kinase PleC